MTRLGAVVVGCAAAFALRSARQAETGDHLGRSRPLDHRVRLGLLREAAGATSTARAPARGSPPISPTANGRAGNAGGWTRASSCAPRTTCAPRRAARSASGLASRRAAPPASAVAWRPSAHRRSARPSGVCLRHKNHGAIQVTCVCRDDDARIRTRLAYECPSRDPAVGAGRYRSPGSLRRVGV
jgi:hypothetical protein